MSENLYTRNGTWWIRYNVDGRQVRQSLGTESLKEAKRLRNEVLGARDGARDPRAKLGLPVEAKAPEPRPVPTLGDVADKWLAHREADPDLTEHSRAKSNTVVECHIRPVFGPRIMSTITKEEVESWVATLRNVQKQSSVANTFGQLRSLVRWTIRRGLYEGRDFTVLEKPPRPGPGKDIVLSVDEIEALLSHLNGQLRDITTVAAFTGARPGEVEGLAWADFDLDATPPTLTVKRSYRDGKPKTKASGKPVPIHAELAALLRLWKAASSSEWLFPGRGGLPRHQTPIKHREALRAAAKAAGITKSITPYVLRHSFATLAYETTQDPRAVQALMRHTDFRTTLRYVHERRDLSDRVNAMPSFTTKPKLRSV